MRKLIIGIAIPAFAVVAVVVWVISSGMLSTPSDSASAESSPAASASAEPLGPYPYVDSTSWWYSGLARNTPVTCPAEFVQVDLSHADGKVDADFSVKFAEATANATDSETLNDLMLEVAGSNAHTLAIWASSFGLYEDPNNWASLVEDDCLSQEGQALWNQFQGALKSSTGVTIGEAPSDGTNSGVDESGRFGVAEQSGVRGDRKAIYIELRDGSSVWIMVRCGNVVYLIPPPMLPKVPTDDPWPRGNAPEGGGPNIDQSEGDYIPPAEMDQPSTTPRVNEPAPAPSAPPVGSTPDPTPAPAPETSAPEPEDPSEGTSCAPGITSC